MKCKINSGSGIAVGLDRRGVCIRTILARRNGMATWASPTKDSLAAVPDVALRGSAGFQETLRAPPHDEFYFAGGVP